MYLALLVTVRQYLQTVRCDGEKLHVHALQQSYHLLETVSWAYGQLCTLLMQQQVVQRRYCIKQDGLDSWTASTFTTLLWVSLFAKCKHVSNTASCAATATNLHLKKQEQRPHMSSEDKFWFTYLLSAPACLLTGPQWAWSLNRRYCNFEVFFKFSYLRDTEADKCQNSISSSLCTDTYVVIFSWRSDQ